MPDPLDRSPKSKNKLKGFKYSQNGEDYVEEQLSSISRTAYSVANQKAKLKAKKKPIEVSEEHLRDATDFVLKTGIERPWYHWIFKILVTLAYILGGVFVKEGFGDFSFNDGQVSYPHILSGVAVLILVTIIDIFLVSKK